ncbi:hypothetical protein I2I11_01040 [Pontibacter sp. 172403-2]|uniref:ligand-binding sensor domain-containing protein n=1 Tax=Pontibacter rufus TaxID=2791028 RepID=UPI0018AFD0CE|nr:two-component regulator propeller domain-containing protein [Pontibacter sp. 172403-2]MBF9251870.1 hypothetical protein [Pontibacter sp. 172403-2]
MLILLILWPVLLQAQQYNFRNWTLEDGLPQSQVRDVLQDNKKQLWIATRGGVSRFDGTNFYTYTRQQGLSSNNISCLFQDSRGRIWAGTSDHGLNVLENDRFRSIRSDRGLSGTDIHSIAEDTLGRVWVASAQGLFYSAGSRFMKYFGLPDQAYTSLLVTPAGDVWAGSKTDGLYHIGGQPRHFTVYNSPLPSNSVTSLALHHGQVWVGTSLGIASILDGKLSAQRLPSTVSLPAVSSLTEDAYGDLWAGFENNGLLKISGDSLTHITRSNGLRTNHVNTLAADVEGDVWVGTDGYGLQQYKAPWFVHYFDFESITEPRITALTHDAQGRVWFGTDDGLAAYVHGSEPEPLQKKVWPDGTTLHNLLVQQQDSIWICTSNGIWHLMPDTVRHYTVADGLPSDTVYQCVPDAAGNLWFATANGAAVLANDTLTQVGAGTKESPMRIYCILPDSKGNMWFGTESGVYRLQNGRLQHPPELKSYHMEEVTTIAEDKAGNLYFGVFNYGIVMLRPKGGSLLLNAAAGLPNEGIRSLYADARDNLWAGTSRSLLKIRLAPLRRNSQLSYRAFTSQEGFSGIEVGYNTITQTPDGTLWFGTVKGLTRYIPDLDRHKKVYPQVRLNNILLFLKPTNWNRLGFKLDAATKLPKHLRLPYNQNHLTFDYYAISLSAPDKIRYKYRLTGYDEQWSPVTRQSYATYANLAPGTYTFELLACNNNGYWTQEPLRYTFAIIPPIWRREWFIGVLLLLAAATILTVMHLREKNLVKMNSLLEMKVQHRTGLLERKNREKETLLQEIHHRVKNNLQIVISMLNLQARHVEDPLAQEVMRAIRGRVRSMSLLHERLYRHDDLGQIDLEDYFRSICDSLYASYGKDEQQVGLRLEVPPIKLDIDAAITLGLIINELISNTLKYAFPVGQKGLLHIQLKHNNNGHYTLTVSDNGRGLPEGFALRQKQSFGLQLVASLSKKLNGEITFSNENGTKTILYFVLPS